MSTPYAERELGHYLRNALRSEASAQLLKPVADATAVVLGTAAPGGTSQDLERAIDAFPSSGTDAEPFERNARYAATEFALDEAELDTLLLALRVRRGRQLARFGSAVQAIMGDPSRVIAILLGHHLDRVQQRLAPEARLCGCGLIVFDDDDIYEDGFPAILAISRAAAPAMFAVHAGRDEWRAALIGRPCEPGLPWNAFDHLGAAGALAARVLAAAAAEGEAGIHILLAGPPGTGKTEFARALATRAGLALYAAGEEADAQGSEPSRSARGTALRLSLTLLRQRRDAAVLLDEAEDLLDSTRSFGARRDAFSKVFLNRTLEQAAVPVLWTCNEIGWMDPATLRRMTLVVQMPVPDAARPKPPAHYTPKVPRVQVPPNRYLGACVGPRDAGGARRHGGCPRDTLAGVGGHRGRVSTRRAPGRRWPGGVGGGAGRSRRGHGRVRHDLALLADRV